MLALQKWQLCSALNERVLGTRWKSMEVFSKKNIELNKCGKVDFLQIRHLFIVEMRKAFFLKAVQNRGLTALPKSSVAIGKLQYDLHQHQK